MLFIQVRMKAWLESEKGERLPLGASTSIGRQKNNDICLPDPRVSRQHAMIHCQDGGEFWIVDMGARNGTTLNDQWIKRSTRLKDGDVIAFKDLQFTFRCDLTLDDSRAIAGETDTFHLNQTVTDYPVGVVWMMLLDVEGFTRMSKEMAEDELARTIGKWTADCQSIIEQHQGRVNKYLGDAILSYWPATASNKLLVHRAAEALIAKSRSSDPSFRMVWHYGKVSRGPAGMVGEENLMGEDLNYLFRIEKVAKIYKVRTLWSHAAKENWKEGQSLTHLGQQSVDGFESRDFYTHSE